MNYKNYHTDQIISRECYDKLPLSEKSKYHCTTEDTTHVVKEEDGDFLLSAAVAYATDSAIIGGLVGGDMMGGIVGDLLNDSNDSSFSSDSSSDVEYGGGDFGGGGSGDSW